MNQIIILSLNNNNHNIKNFNVLCIYHCLHENTNKL